MLATGALLLLAVAFFEAVSRSGTPREARRPLTTLTSRDHLVAAWAGVVLLTRTHERAAAPTRVDGPPPTRPAAPACSSPCEMP